MIAIIFEVEPHADKATAYFDMAADLKPVLEKMEGFISVERFESLMQPGKYLSLSFWRDEDALVTWRNETRHRVAQNAGRHEMFADYRLRVASVIRDYGMFERDEAPTIARAAEVNSNLTVATNALNARLIATNAALTALISDLSARLDNLSNNVASVDLSALTV